MPTLTVALPTCNGARHLREALTSIHSQVDAEFDLLVADDRSEDDTLTIVREVFGDRARIERNSERLGLAGNWNRCVELSRTEWVAIFHQDDVMHPGHLTNLRRVIAAAPEDHPSERIGLVAGRVVMIDDAGQPISPRLVSPGGLHLRAARHALPGKGEPIAVYLRRGTWVTSLAETNPFRCSAVTIRKAAHEDVGGFDPSYRYVVDWEFWLKVARKWGMAWCPGPPSVSMRWHSSSETQRFQTGTADLEETTRLLDAIDRIDGPDNPWVRKVRRSADRTLARAYLNRAHVALKGGNATLARESLDRSIRLAPGILGTIAVDLRLAFQMATLKATPELAVRWFANRGSDE